MNTKDVLKIIRASERAGLESLELEGLKLRFLTGDAEKPMVTRVESRRPPTEPEPIEDIGDDDALEDELASMQIDDPLRFEELIVERDIELGEESGQKAPHGR